LEITLDKKNNTEGTIKIKLTEGDYQPKVEEKVRDYAHKANIKGFRPGKVPNGVIKKMFGKSILVDEINHILSHKISDYIKDNNIKILGEPLPDQEKAGSIDWEAQKDFEFEYQIGMVDDFQYELSNKVKVKSYPIEVDNKIIDETIADLRKRFGKVNYPEAAEVQDNLYGDLKEKDGGENGFKRDYAVIAIEKVEKKEQKKFIGLQKENEVEFDIDKIFGNEEDKANLLGLSPEESKEKKGTYLFKISTISRVEPAEVNQELFDRVFGKDAVKTEEEFSNKVKETIGENYKRESDHFLEHNIEDYYVANTKINLPDNFLKQWIKNTSEGKVTDDVLSEEFDSYKRGLVWDIVKNKIAEDNKLTVETEEVRNKAKDLIIAQFGGQAFAEQISDKMDAIADNYLSNENGQNFTKLYQQLRNEKILNHIKENISISEKKVSVDEFKKIVAEHKH
jgi:trigger factor